MSEENRTPTRHFVKLGDAHNLGESATANNGEENLRSLLLERRMTSSETDRRIDAIVAPLPNLPN